VVRRSLGVDPQDHVRARAAADVEEQVAAPRRAHRQLVVLVVVAAHEHLVALEGAKAAGALIDLLLGLLGSLSLGQQAVLAQLGLVGVEGGVVALAEGLALVEQRLGVAAAGVGLAQPRAHRDLALAQLLGLLVEGLHVLLDRLLGVELELEGHRLGLGAVVGDRDLGGAARQLAEVGLEQVGPALEPVGALDLGHLLLELLDQGLQPLEPLTRRAAQPDQSPAGALGLLDLALNLRHRQAQRQGLGVGLYVHSEGGRWRVPVAGRGQDVGGPAAEGARAAPGVQRAEAARLAGRRHQDRVPLPAEELHRQPQRAGALDLVVDVLHVEEHDPVPRGDAEVLDPGADQVLAEEGHEGVRVLLPGLLLLLVVGVDRLRRQRQRAEPGAVAEGYLPGHPPDRGLLGVAVSVVPGEHDEGVVVDAPHPVHEGPAQGGARLTRPARNVGSGDHAASMPQARS